jgi:hypothetical protein
MERHSVDAAASLQTLRDELQSLGMVVVTRDDGLEVRTSTFETVRIRLDDAVLRCEVWFGGASRTRARWTFSILSAVIVPGLFLTTGVTAATVSVAFLIVLAAVSQAIRFTVTESIVSRIQMVWLNLRGLSSISAVRDVPGLPPPAIAPNAALREHGYAEAAKPHSELSSHRDRGRPAE